MAANQGQPAGVGLQDMPMEVKQLIAVEIDNDKDLVSFRSAGSVTKNIIDGDYGTFWRAILHKKYDFKDVGMSKQDMARLYQLRSQLFRLGTYIDFFYGGTVLEAAAVKMLQELILESFQGETEANEYGVHHSKNQARLREFLSRSRFINDNRRAPLPTGSGPVLVDEKLAATKIVSFQLIFDIKGLTQKVFAFQETQFAVYRHHTLLNIFNTNHKKANLQWFLHCMNFWRHQMKSPYMDTLYGVIEALDEENRPSAWREPITQDVKPLSKNWRGTFAYLNYQDYHALGGGDLSGDYDDRGVDSARLQALELDFAEKSILPSGQKLDWPIEFENLVQSIENDTRAKRGLRTSGPYEPQKNCNSTHFAGRGEEPEGKYKVLGWLNSLPPQGGIPGWQRFTMMQHTSTNYENFQQDKRLWAYEGVVVPGGRMILGRAWKMDKSGPFILWAVDNDVFDEEIDSSDEE
ncbi:hypothetical protein PTT_19150 [Pyrenophora teres f. teres 0-1]|uniref:Uncharacterized protein n=1 Tax=Pyrenophora teres f. teres (strain 0-1) TaxID=861557 RepID=E3S8B1_PYRTT|nr:hypothetical protein PTT_19150 [Pyrenophora teres f. teres 0-1]